MFLRQPQRHWVLQVLASLSDTMDSVCLICECWELEQYFHSHSTSAINILQRKWYLPPPTKNPSPVWGKGRHVHRCWSGKGRWLAQTVGSPSALMASVSNYVSTPCLVCMPSVQGGWTLQETLSSHVLTTHSRSPVAATLNITFISLWFWFSCLCSLAILFWTFILTLTVCPHNALLTFEY